MSTPCSTHSKKLQGDFKKVQGKLYNRMGQALSKIVNRDTIFVPSTLGAPSASPRTSTDASTSSASPTLDGTVSSPAMPHLPSYDEAMRPVGVDYRANHLRSQDIGLHMIKQALKQKEQEIAEFEEGNALLKEYSETLHFGIDEEALRQEIALLEANLDGLRKKYPTLLPPPIPTRPQSNSNTDWTCVKCGEANREGTYKCQMCRMPSLRICISEMDACKCQHCSGELFETTPDLPGWLIVNASNSSD